MIVSINSEPLPPDAHLTVHRGLDGTNAAWRDGFRLSPGDTIELDEVVVYMEPVEQDLSLREEDFTNKTGSAFSG